MYGTATPAETTVVVWPDTFTDAFNPGAARDIIETFEALGERVAVPSAWACCGRTLYDFGMLDLAKRWLRRLIDVLAPWATANIPVVVPEPSCLAAFRDELPALLPGNPRAARLASLARSPAEHLVAAGHLGQLEAAAQREAAGRRGQGGSRSGGPAPALSPARRRRHRGRTGSVAGGRFQR